MKIDKTIELIFFKDKEAYNLLQELIDSGIILNDQIQYLPKRNFLIRKESYNSDENSIIVELGFNLAAYRVINNKDKIKNYLKSFFQ